MPPTMLGSVFEILGEFLADIASVIPWGSVRRGQAVPWWSIWIGLAVIFTALFAVYFWLG